MSQLPLPPSSADNLQFDVVEPAVSASAQNVGGQAMNCAVCHLPIVTAYYALANKVLCPACFQKVAGGTTGSRAGRLFKAAFFGLAAGLLGAVIWYAIRRIGHVEIGLVAVLVGFMVGKAVRTGSGGVGGRGYQILAVVLTYGCISANYMPDVLEQFAHIDAKHQADAARKHQTVVPSGNATVHAGKVAIAVVLAAAFIFIVSLTVPFLAGLHNLIGLLIIGFALWEAWKLNARLKLPVSGPYQVRAGAFAPALAGRGT